MNKPLLGTNMTSQGLRVMEGGSPEFWQGITSPKKSNPYSQLYGKMPLDVQKLAWKAVPTRYGGTRGK